MSTGQQPPTGADTEVIEATPDDVAALLTARTKDSQGQELGEWTDDTRPTSDQVQTRIDIARALVKQGLGPIPAKCQEGAETVVALLAALLCEAAFWPEQTVNNQSTYERLRELYLQARDGLVACVADPEGGLYGYELNVGGGRGLAGLPIDWWQRNWEDFVGWAGTLG